MKSVVRRAAPLVLALAALISVSGCAVYETAPPPRAYYGPPVVYYSPGPSYYGGYGYGYGHHYWR